MLANPRQDQPKSEVVWHSGDEPIEEGLPDILRLPLLQSLERHPDIHPVTRSKRDDIPPVRIEEAVGVKGDELTDEVTIGGIGIGMDRGPGAVDKGSPMSPTTSSSK